VVQVRHELSTLFVIRAGNARELGQKQRLRRLKKQTEAAAA
jgi:hypothetical protein